MTNAIEPETIESIYERREEDYQNNQRINFSRLRDIREQLAAEQLRQEQKAKAEAERFASLSPSQQEYESALKAQIGETLKVRDQLSLDRQTAYENRSSAISELDTLVHKLSSRADTYDGMFFKRDLHDQKSSLINDLLELHTERGAVKPVSESDISELTKKYPKAMDGETRKLIESFPTAVSRYMQDLTTWRNVDEKFQKCREQHRVLEEKYASVRKEHETNPTPKSTLPRP